MKATVGFLSVFGQEAKVGETAADKAAAVTAHDCDCACFSCDSDPDCHCDCFTCFGN